MTLLETLALLTLIVTVVCETINITLKVHREQAKQKRLTAQPRKLVQSIFFDCIKDGS